MWRTAGGIAGLLHVHAEVDDVGDDLRVGLRLVVAAHHAERHQRPCRLFASIAGTSVCSGRLCGPISLGWPGCSVKPEPRLCSVMPVSPATKPAPKLLKSDWMNEIDVAVPSAAVR